MAMDLSYETLLANRPRRRRRDPSWLFIQQFRKGYAESIKKIEAKKKRARKAACHDCGRPYGDEHGFPDLVIPNDVWRRISPTGNDGGLLCPSCICARLHKASIRCEGAFMSGPIESVSYHLMHTMRWVENLREQGHGWACPKCGEWREQATPPEKG